MIFNQHGNLIGKHAVLSASSWRWLNDDPDQMTARICSQYATTIGTILHDVAYKHIKYRIKMSKFDKKNVMLELLSKGIPSFVIDFIDFDSKFENLMTYVNDGIGFKMSPEVILYYSDNFFGTTDSIAFPDSTRYLRIHDYKSGETPAHMEQLLIYAALFCLEYRLKPKSLDGAELRIYQNKEVIFHNPEPDEIDSVIEKIVSADKFLNNMTGMEG